MRIQGGLLPDLGTIFMGSTKFLAKKKKINGTRPLMRFIFRSVERGRFELICRKVKPPVRVL